MAEITAEQKNAMKEAIVAIYEAVHDLGGIPNGHLYAHLMGRLTLDQYNQIIDYMVRNKLLKNENNYLTALPV